MNHLGLEAGPGVTRQSQSGIARYYDEDRLPVIKNVLEKTEGLTSAIGNEDAAFHQVFAHIAPWLTSTSFVQHKSTKRLSQLSLNYRDSSLSVTRFHAGSLRDGDRVPNCVATVVGGQGSSTAAPVNRKLFDLLSPDRFTLLTATW